MSLVSSLRRYFSTLIDVSVKDKVVVFESDDWGSIRSTRESYNRLKNKGFDVNDLYSRYDHLERDEDLEELFSVLNKFKDSNGRNPVYTLNTIVANPDFNRIRNSNFSKYYFEPITDTYNHYKESKNVMSILQQGLQEDLIKIQFHGREHLNFISWMKDLQKGVKIAKVAFDNNVFGYVKENVATGRNNHMAAFDFINHNEQETIINSLNEGLDLFNELFKYKSKTMIAPCYVWSSEVEKASSLKGIEGIQGIRLQFVPTPGKLGYKRKINIAGKKNPYHQKYLVRNTFFEPTHFGIKQNVSKVLERMKFLFMLNRPVVIGSHRINYMGGMSSANKTENLQGLEYLLKEMLSKYPDIKFLSSDELIDLYP